MEVFNCVGLGVILVYLVCLVNLVYLVRLVYLVYLVCLVYFEYLVGLVFCACRVNRACQIRTGNPVR